MSPAERLNAAAELATAAAALRAAAMLLDAGLILDAVSRLYYAVFHAGRAALLARDKRAKTHTGQIAQFAATFGNEPLLGDLLNQRINADYTTDRFDLSADDVRGRLAAATAFVERCRGIVDDEIAKGVDDPDPEPDY
ncbi:MAG: HEPN domain-containing protein [Pseudonocardia sp.]